MKYNAVYGQSGGPTSIINSSLYGVIKQCQLEENIDTLFLMHNGIGGLINDDLVDIKTITQEDIELLPYTPSAICGSIRKKLKEPSIEDEEYQKIYQNLKKHNIRYVFLNGGNDSMDTTLKLASFLKMVNYECYIVGIPKTIDNDLIGTDHTPGFASAAKFIINTMKCLTYDNNCYPKGRVNIVEIMGRDTGWLTASSILANKDNSGPDLIYVPEVDFDINKFLNDVEKLYSKKKRLLIAVSEGIRDKDNNLILQTKAKDAFNHTQLGGVALYLSNLIEEKLHISTRAIELSLLQRCFAPLISKVDQKEAIKCGKQAVKLALKGKSKVMVTIKRISSSPYKIKYSYIELEKVANQVKYIPSSWINKEKNNISSEFISYIEPLIEGKIISPDNKGLYKFSKKL